MKSARVFVVPKVVLFALALGCFRGLVAAAPPEFSTPEEKKAWSSALGTVSVTTVSQRNRTSVTTGPDVYSKNQIHQTGVWVHLGPVSAKAVQPPYEIQCFFVAGGRADVGSRIYNQFRQVSDLPYDAEFFSAPLAGKSMSVRSSDVSLTDRRTGRTYSGTLSTTTSSEGSKFCGWIVRVLVAGKLARVEASLSELKDYARNNPEVLDTIIFAAPSSAPLPGKKPATGFGNTVLDRR